MQVAQRRLQSSLPESRGCRACLQAPAFTKTAQKEVAFRSVHTVEAVRLHRAHARARMYTTRCSSRVGYQQCVKSPRRRCANAPALTMHAHTQHQHTATKRCWKQHRASTPEPQSLRCRSLRGGPLLISLVCISLNSSGSCGQMPSGVKPAAHPRDEHRRRCSQLALERSHGCAMSSSCTASSALAPRQSSAQTDGQQAQQTTAELQRHRAVPTHTARHPAATHTHCLQ